MKLKVSDISSLGAISSRAMIVQQVKYLGVEVEDALKLAEKTEI